MTMKQYNINRLMISALLTLFVSVAHATEPIDSVDVYQNQTVSSVVVIQGRHQLSVRNVSVTSAGDLKLSAPDEIIVTGSFTVDLGGKLELNGGMQYAIRYSYDVTGNRIRREKVISN